MAIRMFGIGFLGSVMAGKQHDKIRHQVGQGMDAVRDQTLRPGQQADRDLDAAQDDIDGDTDPGAAGRGGATRGDQAGSVLSFIVDIIE